MRRSLWTRTLSALFAVWLALIMGEAGFAHHRCPMHDGPMPASATTVEGGAHAGHSGHQAPNGDAHHGCTCLGACCASSGAVTLAAAPELPTALIGLPSPSVARAPRVSTPAARAVHTLPFANGPPTAIA